MWIRIRIQQLILMPIQTDNPGYCYTFHFLLQFRFVFLEAYSIKGLTYWDLTHLVPGLRHGLWSYSATLLLPPFLQTPALHESNKPNGVLTYIYNSVPTVTNQSMLFFVRLFVIVQLLYNIHMYVE